MCAPWVNGFSLISSVEIVDQDPGFLSRTGLFAVDTKNMTCKLMLLNLSHLFLKKCVCPSYSSLTINASDIQEENCNEQNQQTHQLPHRFPAWNLPSHTLGLEQRPKGLLHDHVQMLQVHITSASGMKILQILKGGETCVNTWDGLVPLQHCTGSICMDIEKMCYSDAKWFFFL